MAGARASTPRVGSTHVSWSGAYGGYMNVHFEFDIVGTVTFGDDDKPNNLHVKISNFTETHDWGTVAGGGFINVGGFMWYEGNYSGKYDSAEDLSDESETLVWNQLTATIPNFATYNIWGLYASDEGSPPAVSGTIDGTSWERDFPLTGEPDVNMMICQSYTRWRENTDPAYAHVDTAGDFNITFHDLFPDYFPFALKSGSSWKSCNRQGGSYQARESATWVDKKNDKNNVAGSKVFIKASSSWNLAPKVGQE